jgi:hypothetical protein
LAYWSVLCAIPVVWLITQASEPVSPECFEWCDLDAYLAGRLVPLILLVWFGVVALVLWLRGRR